MKNVKKLLGLTLAGTMMFGLVACGSSSSSSSTAASVAEEAAAEAESVVEEAAEEAASVAEEAAAEAESAVEEVAEEAASVADEVAAEADPDAEPTAIFHGSNVEDYAGTWTLVQVYADGATADAVENAATIELTLTEDPSELVDEAAYIHNRVYNMSGILTFGIDAINEELAAEDVDAYKGSTAWSDWPQGAVVTEGNWYEQPGAATMRFQDIDICGLFLDQIAGIDADIDTTERTLIIGQNNQGQLLLGYSEEHLERPGTEGDWTYCLIFDKN